MGRKYSVVDTDVVIEGLGLRSLVEKYAFKNFLPIPERIATFNLEE